MHFVQSLRSDIPEVYSKPHDCKADVPRRAPSTVMMKRITSAITFFFPSSIHYKGYWLYVMGYRVSPSPCLPRGGGDLRCSHPDGLSPSGEMSKGQRGAVPLVLIHSTTSGAAAVDDEGCIAVGHLEGAGVGAVAFSQGD